MYTQGSNKKLASCSCTGNVLVIVTSRSLESTKKMVPQRAKPSDSAIAWMASMVLLRLGVFDDDERPGGGVEADDGDYHEQLRSPTAAAPEAASATARGRGAGGATNSPPAADVLRELINASANNSADVAKFLLGAPRGSPMGTVPPPLQRLLCLVRRSAVDGSEALDAAAEEGDGDDADGDGSSSRLHRSFGGSVRVDPPPALVVEARGSSPSVLSASSLARRPAAGQHDSAMIWSAEQRQSNLVVSSPELSPHAVIFVGLDDARAHELARSADIGSHMGLIFERRFNASSATAMAPIEITGDNVSEMVACSMLPSASPAHGGAAGPLHTLAYLIEHIVYPAGHAVHCRVDPEHPAATDFAITAARSAQRLRHVGNVVSRLTYLPPPPRNVRWHDPRAIEKAATRADVVVAFQQIVERWIVELDRLLARGAAITTGRDVGAATGHGGGPASNSNASATGSLAASARSRKDKEAAGSLSSRLPKLPVSTWDAERDAWLAHSIGTSHLLEQLASPAYAGCITVLRTAGGRCVPLLGRLDDTLAKLRDSTKAAETNAAYLASLRDATAAFTDAKSTVAEATAALPACVTTIARITTVAPLYSANLDRFSAVYLTFVNCVCELVEDRLNRPSSILEHEPSSSIAAIAGAEQLLTRLNNTLLTSPVVANTKTSIAGSAAAGVTMEMVSPSAVLGRSMALLERLQEVRQVMRLSAQFQRLEASELPGMAAVAGRLRMLRHVLQQRCGNCLDVAASVWPEALADFRTSVADSVGKEALATVRSILFDHFRRVYNDAPTAAATTPSPDAPLTSTDTTADQPASAVSVSGPPTHETAGVAPDTIAISLRLLSRLRHVFWLEVSESSSDQSDVLADTFVEVKALRSHVDDLLATHFFALVRHLDDVLEATRVNYDAHRSQPPLERNATPIAGAIAWSRLLLRGIRAPTELLQSAGGDAAMRTREVKAVIKKFNRIALTLVTFEQEWLVHWQRTLDPVLAATRATLLVDAQTPSKRPAPPTSHRKPLGVRHTKFADANPRSPPPAAPPTAATHERRGSSAIPPPEAPALVTPMFLVNYDSTLDLALREMYLLRQLGIELPSAAVALFSSRIRLKAIHSELTFAIAELRRIAAIVPVPLRPLFAHRFEAARDMFSADRAANTSHSNTLHGSHTTPYPITTHRRGHRHNELQFGRPR
jgi:hypothetical protein